MFEKLGFDVVPAPLESEPAHANVVKVIVVDEDPAKPWPRSLRRSLIEAGWWALPPPAV